MELTLIEVAQAAAGDDDPSCGRRPTRRLKPIFSHLAAPAVQGQQRTATAAQRLAATNAQRPTTATPPSHTASTPISADNVLQSQSTYQQLATATSNANTASNAQSTTSEKPVTQKLCTPFDADRMTYYWFRYAQQLPKEKYHLMGRMKSMEPQLDTATWTISVELENELVEQYMRKEQISLMNYLRTQLR